MRDSFKLAPYSSRFQIKALLKTVSNYCMALLEAIWSVLDTILIYGLNRDNFKLGLYWILIRIGLIRDYFKPGPY